MFDCCYHPGACSIGLALSSTNLGHRVEEQLIPVNEILVPVFFVVMGRRVDVSSMANGRVFGLIISASRAPVITAEDADEADWYSEKRDRIGVPNLLGEFWRDYE
jgi:hypothetical protein